MKNSDPIMQFFQGAAFFLLFGFFLPDSGIAAPKEAIHTVLEESTENLELNLSLSPFSSGFESPVALANAGDERLFVVEQKGIIRILYPDGTVASRPFLDITDRVDSSHTDEGLLGLAFHPDYSSNGFLFVNYIFTAESRRTRISRFSVTEDPDIADPASEDVLLTIDQFNTSHNGGDIQFGPDGFLYIPLGDGGGVGDANNHAQNRSLLLGKVSRLDVNSSEAGVVPDCVGLGSGHYRVPSGNPFIDGQGGACDEIWSLGLRNPWRSSFDRETGNFFIGDVGQEEREEINFQPSTSTGGENYGWRCYEGSLPYNITDCASVASYSFPIFEYAHEDGNCSVIGGFVYRGNLFPAMVGHYFFTDYCSGNFWSLDIDGGRSQSLKRHTNLQMFGYATFGESNDGELYVANQVNGNLYHLGNSQITPTNNKAIDWVLTILFAFMAAVYIKFYRKVRILSHRSSTKRNKMEIKDA